ncbi:MAG: outer membrane lipoprotein carrier protein LolA [Rikenellaceae bacterium]
MLKISLTILLNLLFLSASAQTDNVEHEFKNKLEKVSSTNTTIQCNFTQIKKVKNIKQPINSKGMFYYNNSGLMALHYSEPMGDKILMNGDSFTIVSSGKKLQANASSNPMMSQISYMMQACMSGDVSKLGRGWNMNVEKYNDEYKVKLTPSEKRIQKYIAAITMYFDNSNLTLNTLRIDEASGGYTSYRFTNKKINQQIIKSIFTIK